MKLPFACGLVASLALAACQAPTGPRANHWNLESLGPRIAYHGFGYRAERDVSYREYQWRQKKAINKTIRRHLFNDNPDNPFQHPIPEPPARRPPNSILPDPITFFHATSLAWGGVMYGATGSFVPIPLDSILGVFEKGGSEEFIDGITYTVRGKKWDDRNQPAPPEEFKVHNP